MGKAKRFNPYDSIVAESRKIIQAYGQARQDLSTKAFRSMPKEPPITTKIRGTGTGDGKFLTVSLSADQTANIDTNDHIEFDTKDEDGGVILQTGSGQADGILELGGGTKYILSAQLRPEFSGTTGQLVVAWYDRTNSAEIGSRAIYESQTHASHNANQPLAEVLVTPATNIDVEVRIISVTALTALANEYCTASVFEIALGFSGSGGGGDSSGVTFPITPTIKDESNTWTSPVTIDLALTTAHITKFTLDGNLTLVFSNPPSSGTQIEFEIEFVQDGTGGRTVTFPASVVETVSIASAASATTIVTCRTNDGGTTYNVIPALRGSITLGGTFARDDLSNLGSVAINTSLISDTDNTDDLGSSGIEWKDLWIDGTANIDTLAATTMSGDITMADKDVTGIGNLVFGTSGAAVNGSPTIWTDATGDMVLNVATGDQFFITINGTTEYSFNATGWDFNANTISDIGNIIPTSSIAKDLGDSNNLWRDIWAERLIFTTNQRINFTATVVTIGGHTGGTSVEIFSAGAKKITCDTAIEFAANCSMAAAQDFDFTGGDIKNLGGTSSHSSGALRLDKLKVINWLNNAGTGSIQILTDTNDDINITNADGTCKVFAEAGFIIGETSAPTTIANKGYIYCKDVSGDTHLFFDNSTETEIDLSLTSATNEFADDVFRVKDNSDATKKMAFEISSITTSTTRTLTVPDSNLTLAGINIAQTFTNTQTFNDNVVLGSTNADTINVNGDFISDLNPNAADTYDIGGSATAEHWRHAYFDGTVTLDALAANDASAITLKHDFDITSGKRINYPDTSAINGTGSAVTPPTTAAGYILVQVAGVQKKIVFWD